MPHQSKKKLNLGMMSLLPGHKKKQSSFRYMLCIKVCLRAISGDVGITNCPWVLFAPEGELSVRVTKITSRKNASSIHNLCSKFITFS